MFNRRIRTIDELFGISNVSMPVQCNKTNNGQQKTVFMAPMNPKNSGKSICDSSPTEALSRRMYILKLSAESKASRSPICVLLDYTEYTKKYLRSINLTKL